MSAIDLDDPAASWNARYAASDAVWSTSPNAWVARVLADLTPGTAVDLACGEGRNAIWLASLGWSVTGVDFSSVGVETARARAAASGIEATWVVGDATTWLPEAPVDLVLVAYLHLPPDDFARALTLAAASLAPGGTLAVIGHDRDNLVRGVGGPQDAAILTSARVLRRLARTAGLTVELAEQLERPVGDAVAIDTILLARR